MPDPAFSDVINTENQEPVPFSSTNGGFNGVGDSKISNLEAQRVVSFLRKATAEALSLSEADPQSKKLLHALLEMVIEIHETVPEERDRIEEVLAAKTRIVFVCVLLFVLAMVMTLFFTSRPRHSFGKPPPT
ncbi:hypothetical protein PanWU01x14_157550 [Parasponia andersonii]|uniref:Transmembrane protein n=1 Tax=Parasponia andersonii TaxID=3476 RepID=A0A2P5CFA1_PARAD|nr:hypothetical protein PanWU01x14_157550 [Parasponia andersonii]